MPVLSRCKSVLVQLKKWSLHLTAPQTLSPCILTKKKHCQLVEYSEKCHFQFFLQHTSSHSSSHPLPKLISRGTDSWRERSCTKIASQGLAKRLVWGEGQGFKCQTERVACHGAGAAPPSHPSSARLPADVPEPLEAQDCESATCAQFKSGFTRTNKASSSPEPQSRPRVQLFVQFKPRSL